MHLQRPRIIHIYLAIAFFVTLFFYGIGSASAVEAAAPELKLSADRQSYPLNDTISITVLARGVTDLYAVKWDIDYDAQYAAFVEGSVQNAAWPEGYLHTKAAPGLISAVSSKLGAAAGDSGDYGIVTLRFKPLKQGETVIRLNRLSASDSSLQLLSFAEPGELSLRITAPDETPPNEVSSEKSKELHDQVTLTWDDPKDEDFVEVRVYLDGERKSVVPKGAGQTVITGLTPKTDYRFLIKTVDRVGNESAGVTVKAKTKNDSHENGNSGQ